jgi:hypothetical protein
MCYFGVVTKETLKIVYDRLLYMRVEAAFPLAARYYVPQRYIMAQQEQGTPLVVFVVFLSEKSIYYAPESVPFMPVILMLAQRRFSRHGAEYQYPAVIVLYRRE